MTSNPVSTSSTRSFRPARKSTLALRAAARAVTKLRARPAPSGSLPVVIKRGGGGVLHVTDDVELFAKSAVGDVSPLPNVVDASSIQGKILTDACRWYEFRVDLLEDSQERTRIECEVTVRGRNREFFGFNRAKHAVIEAAILATRLHLIPPEDVREDFDRLATIVQKTAGPAEIRAFDFLDEFVRRSEDRFC